MKDKLGGFGLVLALLAGLLLGVPTAHAKPYLTREQAEEICFPEADTIEWKSHRYTPAQAMAIRKASGLMVIDPGIWYGVVLKDKKVVVAGFDKHQINNSNYVPGGDRRIAPGFEVFLPQLGTGIGIQRN